jgi:hypothetical protein
MSADPKPFVNVLVDDVSAPLIVPVITEQDAEHPSCPPDCEDCDIDEVRALAALRKLALDAPDWYATAAHAGLAPSDLHRFLIGVATLTTPQRATLRRVLEAKLEDEGKSE